MILMRDTKLVWTSDPDEAKRLRETSAGKVTTDAPATSQTIRVTIDKKRRAGKSVTVATGFQISAESLSRLASQLKKKCGSGGTAKDGEIEIQGEHVDSISRELIALGYRIKR